MMKFLLLKIRYCRVVLIGLLSILLPSCFNDDVLTPQGEIQKFLPGEGVVTYAEYAPLADKPIRIHYKIPIEGDMKEMPVLLVFPGQERNADDYLKAWSLEASAKRFMVFVFEFPQSSYSSSEYNEGGMYIGHVLQNQEEWTFSVIEPVFDKIIQDTGSLKKTYDMWGHSAGAQFVHRFFTFMESARLNRAISANAGWYTVPDELVEFPYGIKNTPVGVERLGRIFSRQLIIDLGTDDTSRDGLNTSSGAEAQGKNRFERGNFYYAEAKRISQECGCQLKWVKHEVLGVGHEYTRMAMEAAGYLY